MFAEAYSIYISNNSPFSFTLGADRQRRLTDGLTVLEEFCREKSLNKPPLRGGGGYLFLILI